MQGYVSRQPLPSLVPDNIRIFLPYPREDFTSVVAIMDAASSDTIESSVLSPTRRRSPLRKKEDDYNNRGDQYNSKLLPLTDSPFSATLKNNNISVINMQSPSSKKRYTYNSRKSEYGIDHQSSVVSNYDISFAMDTESPVKNQSPPRTQKDKYNGNDQYASISHPAIPSDKSIQFRPITLLPTRRKRQQYLFEDTNSEAKRNYIVY